MTALHYAATSDYNMPIIALSAAYGAKIREQRGQIEAGWNGYLPT